MYFYLHRLQLELIVHFQSINFLTESHQVQSYQCKFRYILFNPCTQSAILCFDTLKNEIQNFIIRFCFYPQYEKWNSNYWQSVYPKCHFVFLINWKTKFKNSWLTPCMESTIQKINFLKNETCIFLHFLKIWKTNFLQI